MIFQGLIYDWGVPLPFYLLEREGKRWSSIKASDSLDWLISALSEFKDNRFRLIVNRAWLPWALLVPYDFPLVIWNTGRPEWWWPRDRTERVAAVITAATLYCAAMHKPLPGIGSNGMSNGIEIPEELYPELLPEGLGLDL